MENQFRFFDSKVIIIVVHTGLGSLSVHAIRLHVNIQFEQVSNRPFFDLVVQFRSRCLRYLYLCAIAKCVT